MISLTRGNPLYEEIHYTRKSLKSRGPALPGAGAAVANPLAEISKAPKGNGIGATGSKNWVWF